MPARSDLSALFARSNSGAASASIPARVAKATCPTTSTEQRPFFTREWRIVNAMSPEKVAKDPRRRW